jgi:fatty acid desaturase
MNVISRLNRPPKAADPLSAGHLVASPIDKQTLGSLSTINPIVSTYHILGEWTVIVTAIWVCQRFWSPLLYCGAALLIAARQHALLILMHDGTHYRLFHKRAINDWITEIFLAWPLLVKMRTYRRNHFAHHRFLNSDRDPDWTRKQGEPSWRFPQSAKRLAATFLYDLSGLGGINLIRLASSFKEPTESYKAYGRARVLFYVVALGVASVTCGIKILLLYWAAPYLTWLIVIMHLRSIAEHFAISHEGICGATRSIKANVVERMFIAPKNVGYHTEHHLFPSVPFYRLPTLNKMLLSNREFIIGTYTSASYWQVVRECVGVSRARIERPASPIESEPIGRTG